MTVASGSYRDPENAAVGLDGRWFRVAAPESAGALRRLLQSPEYRALVERGALVRFEHVESSMADDVIAESARTTGRRPRTGSEVFEVETVPLITYPWEWPNTLLASAGFLTLDIRQSLLGIGLDLKDASAFNVQFRGSRPVLIDLGSIETWRPNPSWNATRQYVEHFINPLAVGSGKHVTAADAWELSHRRGLRSDVARPLMPARQRRRPSLWVLQTSTRPVADHAPVETKYAQQAQDSKDLALRATQSLTRRLRKQTGKVSGARHSTTWSEYGSREHYDETSLSEKLGLTRQFVSGGNRRDLVLDIGGNDGLTACDLVTTTGARVVVMDPDAGALDVLSARLATDPVLAEKITPLYADLTNLTADSGLLDAQFMGIARRMRPTAVVCQAVLHHIVITQGVPMALAVAALARFNSPLLIEFATLEDPKVALLLRQIPNWSGEYSTQALLGALREHYELVDVQGTTSSTRVVVTTGDPRG